MQESRWARLVDRARAVEWFDVILRLVGVAALLVSVFCAYVTVALIVDFGDGEPGFVKTIEGYGIALFAVSTIVAFFTGKWFLGDSLLGRRRNRGFGATTVIRRHQVPAFVRALAADDGFRATRSWDERREIAARRIPQLHEAFVGDDWDQKMLAESVVKDAWSQHLRQTEP